MSDQGSALDIQRIGQAAEHIDGAAWQYAVIRLGKLGRSETTHGAPDRWDWGRTAYSLARAIAIDTRMTWVRERLTPEQLATVTAGELRAKVEASL